MYDDRFLCVGESQLSREIRFKTTLVCAPHNEEIRDLQDRKLLPNFFIGFDKRCVRKFNDEKN